MSRPPRLPGFEYAGRHSYFLTFCTDKRAETLRDPALATMVLECMRRSSDRYGFAVLAYCLMPDHVHLLVHGTSPAADLRRFVKTMKQSSGQMYAARTKRRLWQESYYDHVVRPEEHLSAIARYIIDNPVRAGIVQSPLDYPFVGSDVWPVEAVVRGDQCRVREGNKTRNPAHRRSAGNPAHRRSAGNPAHRESAALQNL